MSSTSVTSSFSTILILGATSGLGEAFTKYFHGAGKTVIAAGRRTSRLSDLASTLPGLQTLQFDVSDITNLETNLRAVIASHPDLDAVFVMAGKMNMGDFTTGSSGSTKDGKMSTAEIVSEITTNLIAPCEIARVMVPYFVERKKAATFITVSSGLAYIPLPLYPVYNATKAGIHALSVSIRSQVAGTDVRIVELAPPYVATELDLGWRENAIEASGGKGKAHPPMPLAEYMAASIKTFEEEGDVKEVATGFSAMGVGAWRGAFGPAMSGMGLKG